MGKIVKSFFTTLGVAIIGLFLINLVFFVVAYVGADTTESWSASFRHGSFKLNDEIVGYPFGSFTAGAIIATIVGLIIGRELKKESVNAL